MWHEQGSIAQLADFSCRKKHYPHDTLMDYSPPRHTSPHVSSNNEAYDNIHGYDLFSNYMNFSLGKLFKSLQCGVVQMDFGDQLGPS